MLVKATGMSSKLGVRIKELRRIAYEGETFEVTPLRFRILSGENRFRAKFVTEVKEVYERDDVETFEEEKPAKEVTIVEKEEVKEEATEEPVEEVKPKKRGRKAKAKNGKE